MQYWNRGRITRALREKSQELGYSPSTREVEARLCEACKRYFGSFNNAKKATELPINPVKHHKLKRNSKHLNENLAYILGVEKGDGHARIRRTPERTSGMINLVVTDQDFAREFWKKLRDWSGIEPKFYERDKKFFVALYSIDAVNIVQGINFERIIASNKKIKGKFLKGLYDSDGGVIGKNLDRRRFACRWIHFSNNNKEIIETVSQLLKDFDINHKVKSRIHSGFGSTKLQYEILIFGLENFERFYRDIGFSIGYKQDTLSRVINSYEKYRNKISF